MRRFIDIVQKIYENEINHGELLFKQYCREINVRPNPVMIHLLKHYHSLEYDNIDFSFSSPDPRIVNVMMIVSSNSTHCEFRFSDEYIQKLDSIEPKTYSQYLDEVEMFVRDDFKWGNVLNQILGIKINSVGFDFIGLPSTIAVYSSQLTEFNRLYFPDKVKPWLDDISKFVNEAYK